MRESNFAFPAQNRACVCITSQLYDRRALDTTSPLPLFNSLTHLNYLTSTSPRIREIMTMDGGLERLVRILHDFCISPPPPENPAHIYGLSPPNYRPTKPQPTLNPQNYDKHAAYRFSLAFQSVVNIGVRGSEPIRSRVVQAGTLEVVGCVLEAWLANKGFAVGPSSSATGMPRETREQRHARRQAQAYAEQRHRQREEAAELARALQRQIQVDQIVRAERVSAVLSTLTTQESDAMQISPAPTPSAELVIITDSDPVSPAPSNDTDTDASTDTSVNTTPLGSGTPTGTVVVPGRDRSGTVIARTQWDERTTAGRTRPQRHGVESSPSPDTSRPDTETEDDGDIDMDQSRADGSPSPEPRNVHLLMHRPRRTIGIVSDVPPADAQVNGDAHIIINDADSGVVVDGVGGEEGIVSLEPNDDFAMGAPPGAPGAIDEGTTPRTMEINVIRATDTIRAGRNPPDATPRAGTMNLPATSVPDTTHARGIVPRDTTSPPAQTPRGMQRSRTITANDANPPPPPATGTTTTSQTRVPGSSGPHHHRETDSGPYRDEDVLLGLQLLAYLSKYPHVRQAFYKPRASFHPASAQQAPVGTRPAQAQQPAAGPSSASTSRDLPSFHPSTPHKESSGSAFLRVFQTATRAKEKEKEKAASLHPQPNPAPNGQRMTNVFSLVERFTFRPSSTETDLPNPPPKLPPEIQYWAGVIMRNACRKDESRGGIRQCANMLCGRWETFPREFAKCRRCRKAKYCGKECQSTAWSEGHRFWCSAKDGDEDGGEHHHGHHGHHGHSHGPSPFVPGQAQQGELNIEIAGGDETTAVPVVFGEGGGAEGVAPTGTGTVTAATQTRAERRAERERDRLRDLFWQREGPGREVRGSTTAAATPAAQQRVSRERERERERERLAALASGSGTIAPNQFVPLVAPGAPPPRYAQPPEPRNAAPLVSVLRGPTTERGAFDPTVGRLPPLPQAAASSSSLTDAGRRRAETVLGVSTFNAGGSSTGLSWSPERQGSSSSNVSAAGPSGSSGSGGSRETGESLAGPSSGRRKEQDMVLDGWA